jgi:hypothetical protein
LKDRCSAISASFGIPNKDVVATFAFNLGEAFRTKEIVILVGYLMAAFIAN